MESPRAEPSAILFPAGPTYAELMDSDERIAWVRYKVWSADWYTGTLSELGGRFGDWQGYVGVEMALDGAFAALSTAFDASVALMIQSAEFALDVPDNEKLKSHDYKWSALKQIVRNTRLADFPLLPDLIQDVDEGLKGAFDPEPTGWLAILRRFRNRVSHQAALPRTWSINWHTDEVESVGFSDLPGLDPVEYLKTACDQVSDLTERMLSTANQMGFIGATTPLLRTRWT